MCEGRFGGTQRDATRKLGKTNRREGWGVRRTFAFDASQGVQGVARRIAIAFARPARKALISYLFHCGRWESRL